MGTFFIRSNYLRSTCDPNYRQWFFNWAVNKHCSTYEKNIFLLILEIIIWDQHCIPTIDMVKLHKTTNEWGSVINEQPCLSSILRSGDPEKIY